MNLQDLLSAMEQTAVQTPRKVPVPGWPDGVYVRALTVSEVEDQAADTTDKKDKNRLARAACRRICNEKGVRLLDPDNPDHVAIAAKQPWELLRKVLEDEEPGN